MQFILTWIWAGIPIWLNVQALLARGDYLWLPVIAIAGLAAPMGIWLAAMLRSPVWKAVAVFGGLLASLYNITNAIGSSAEHRQSFAAPNQERIERRESMLRRDAELADRIAKIGWRLNGDTSASIKAGIKQLKTTPHYISSNGCLDLKRRDPEHVCFKLEGETGRLAEAVQVESFEAERERIRKDLLKVEAPASADIQLSTFKTLISYIWNVREVTIAAIIAGIGSLILELVGTLLPAAAGRYYAERNESGTATAQLPTTVIQNGLQNGLQNGNLEPSIASFLEEVAEVSGTGDDDTILCRQLYAAYRQWCMKKAIKPVTEGVFGFMMENSGYNRVVHNRRRYYAGIRCRSVQLRVVS